MPSDAEKPLLENNQCKTTVSKSANSVSFIKFGFSRDQNTLKFFLNSSPAIFLASLCYRKLAMHAIPWNSWRWHLIRPTSQKGHCTESDFICLSLCERTRSKFEYGVSLNSLALYHSSKINLFYVIGYQSGHPTFVFFHPNIKQYIQEDLAVIMGWRFGNFVRSRGCMFWRPLAEARIFHREINLDNSCILYLKMTALATVDWKGLCFVI